MNSLLGADGKGLLGLRAGIWGLVETFREHVSLIHMSRLPAEHQAVLCVGCFGPAIPADALVQDFVLN